VNEAANMIGSVESRFDGADYGSASEHFRIKTTTAPPGSLTISAAQERIEKLDSISKATAKDTTRRVSQKTKEILIKSHAIGNESISIDDRLYVTLNFSINGGKVHHFFKRSSSLGEMLNYIANTQSLWCFGTAIRPENQSLALFTEDSPDWKSWDRSAAVDDLLDNFEDVFITAESLDEVVDAQRLYEELAGAAKSTTATKSTISTQSGSGSATSSNVTPVDEKFTVGEVVEYQHKLSDGSGKETIELVTIVAVHYDDFPNIYYTIKYNSNNREKQTDANRLKRISGGMGAGATGSLSSGKSSGRSVGTGTGGVRTVAVAGNPLLLKVTHGARHIEVSTIGEENTISQLKEVISRETGVAPKNQKLIFKGSVLKDIQTLKASKLLNGSKISMIGSG
jgi:uncharacterized spore protein YtfJ